jgi:hypothetical protein
MKVQYEDIMNAAGSSCNFDKITAICIALRNYCMRNKEYLIIECESLRGGWIPSNQVKSMADFFILDGKLIKDRFGNGLIIEKI